MVKCTSCGAPNPQGLSVCWACNRPLTVPSGTESAVDDPPPMHVAQPVVRHIPSDREYPALRALAVICTILGILTLCGGFITGIIMLFVLGVDEEVSVLIRLLMCFGYWILGLVFWFMCLVSRDFICVMLSIESNSRRLDNTGGTRGRMEV